MSAFFKQRIRGIRSITSIISIALMIVSLGALVTNGLNMGLDFTGGMVTEVKVDNSISHEQISPLMPQSAHSVPFRTSLYHSRRALRLLRTSDFRFDRFFA